MPQRCVIPSLLRTRSLQRSTPNGATSGPAPAVVLAACLPPPGGGAALLGTLRLTGGGPVRGAGAALARTRSSHHGPKAYQGRVTGPVQKAPHPQSQ